MKRKMGMLLAIVLLTVLAGGVGPAGAANVYTYCSGSCSPGGQPVFYRCGYGVSGPSCCQQAQSACPGGWFEGVCEENYGTFYCY